MFSLYYVFLDFLWTRYQLFTNSNSPRFLCRPTAPHTLARAVERQRATHTENSGSASPTPGRHTSTLRGYRTPPSIRNPYTNRFTNHPSTHPQPSHPQKAVPHPTTARFRPRSHDSAICPPLLKHLSRDYEKTTITAMYHGRWFAYKQTNKYLYCQSYMPVKAEQLT